ncbi:MAG: hypothetical protein R3358_10745 [Woeseiaceae bacterium]|nr:hypothetical protein [Woeseiaceae bacterium]
MRWVLLFMSVLLFACGGESSDDASDNETIGAEIADDYNDAMDRAKDLEDQIQQSKDDIDAALEDAEAEIDD